MWAWQSYREELMITNNRHFVSRVQIIQQQRVLFQFDTVSKPPALAEPGRAQRLNPETRDLSTVSLILTYETPKQALKVPWPSFPTAVKWERLLL